MRMVNWYHVVSCYFPTLLIALCLLLMAQVGREGVAAGAIGARHAVLFVEGALITPVAWKVTVLFVVGIALLVSRNKPVYLLDFAVWEPPAEWRVTRKDVVTLMAHQGVYTTESLDFIDRVLANSGIGESTALPPGIVRAVPGSAFHPPGDEPAKVDATIEAARKEAEVVICDVVRDVLARTGTSPRQVDILVINCSLFSPTPSLCAMVAHKFSMRSNLVSFNLGGMGCSAGVIAIGLAQDLLAARPGSLALVVSTENITQNLYQGNERGMLLQNSLFRCGGAAILLSNRWTDAPCARFKLLHLVRTQLMTDQAYETVWESEDAEGKRGVRLSKDIVKVAGRNMEKMFTVLAPYVLPWSEQAKVIQSMARRFLYGYLRSRAPRPRLYQPDFKAGIDHFCIHAGGRAVIDAVAANLDFAPHHAEPSRRVLYNYGNTSSSSIWYELDYIRREAPLHRGQRVLQVAFGSGFKCNSMVWLCLQEPKR